MRFRIESVLSAWALCGILVATGSARAQTGTPDGSTHGQKSCSIVDESGKTVVWPNCKPPAEDKVPPVANGDAGADAAKKFPFPGEAPAAGNPDVATKPANSTDLPAAKRFPFPGEQPDAGTPATARATDGGLQDAGSSGSSSSSSSSSANGEEGGTVGPLADDDDAAKAAAARKAARHKLPPVARQSPDEREAEDLKVASFYMDDKNYRGAYSRATDAVQIAADDADAQFALAEAARRLGKLDEALTHYKKALMLDPVPKVKKASEKALKEMAGG